MHRPSGLPLTYVAHLRVAHLPRPIEHHGEDPPAFLTWPCPPQQMLIWVPCDPSHPASLRLSTTPCHATQNFHPLLIHTSVHLSSCFRANVLAGMRARNSASLKLGVLLCQLAAGMAGHVLGPTKQNLTWHYMTCPRKGPQKGAPVPDGHHVYVNLRLFSLAPPTVPTSDSWPLCLCVHRNNTQHGMHLRHHSSKQPASSLLSGSFLHRLHRRPGPVCCTVMALSCGTQLG